MKSKKIIIFSALIAAIAIAGWAIYQNVIVSEENLDYIKGSGIVEGNSVIVSSKLPGELEEIIIDEGHLVEKGQLIGKLSSERIEAKVKQAEAQLEIAKIQVESAKSSQKQIQQGESAYKVAVAQKKLAEAGLKEANAILKDATILAPTNGRITLKMIDAGELVNEGTPIVEIIDLSKLDLTVYISEKQIGKVKLGQKATVFIDSFNDKEFKGQVSFISDKAEFTPKNIHMEEDRVNLVYGVKIRLEDTNGIIKPGMPANAVIK